jgi:hypothetical protein
MSLRLCPGKDTSITKLQKFWDARWVIRSPNYTKRAPNCAGCYMNSSAPRLAKGVLAAAKVSPFKIGGRSRDVSFGKVREERLLHAAERTAV